MKEFLLIFRNDPPAGNQTMTAEQLKEVTKPWQDWIGGIAAQDKLASPGARLSFEGATLRGDTITDGPYAEIKELLLGYTIVKTETLDEAIELAKACPILPVGGTVEVRYIAPMNM